jgi:hypothetical protein
MEILKDLWEAESGFCKARHKVATGYMDAYNHASSWGTAELRPAAGTASSTPTPSSGRILGGADLAGARHHLRSVIVDTCFRSGMDPV